MSSSEKPPWSMKVLAAGATYWTPVMRKQTVTASGAVAKYHELVRLVMRLRHAATYEASTSVCALKAEVHSTALCALQRLMLPSAFITVNCCLITTICHRQDLRALDPKLKLFQILATSNMLTLRAVFRLHPRGCNDADLRLHA